MSKQILITKKSRAMSLLADSLFKSGGTLTRILYCTGKYKPEAIFTGKIIDDVSDDIVAIYAESRRDIMGAFKVLYCLTSK